MRKKVTSWRDIPLVPHGVSLAFATSRLELSVLFDCLRENLEKLAQNELTPKQQRVCINACSQLRELTPRFDRMLREIQKLEKLFPRCEVL